MLDTATRRRIDTARDILVGKVPDPKSQVEQITIALIYKFMDDMDALSEELGGVRKFFADGYSQYGWARLMRSGLGGHEALNLYAEAIAKMPENPGLPPLFRTIFKNAYLPYRDPETLRAFLKIIDEFEYDHSERLGDAYEYLLSVLGSQGDAGQFRTPRHIIDFLVAVVDPKKHEVIIDPAAGTAGFLISSYKHILRENTDAGGGCTLNPDEKARLARNLRGYDISPDMVRLALVNMYLHGFTDPHIHEYDTLTSLDRWNEHADVFMANPPFMSPKGGIRPHNRFTVQSKRSEVLFVNYMADHLTPNGRAGIIVPEGIIFQSQTAYRQLRKMLVTDSLVAVISLPAGVFQPYSGVKTSILILDKSLAKRSATIGFFKVENDGYGLGAQRRPIDKNDLPLVLTEITAYLRRQRAGEPLDDYQPTKGLIVERDKVAANGEYNLSGERYRVNAAFDHKYQLVKIGEVCSTSSGGTPQSGNPAYYDGGTIPWLRSGEVGQGEVFHSEMFITEEGLKNSSAKLFSPNTVLVAMYGATAGEVGILRFESSTNQAICGITPSEKIIPEFLYLLLKANKPALIRLAGGGAQPNISQRIIRDFEIPLPPLEVQKEIIAEIEGYQRVIDGARAVIDNYRPHIPIDPEWPVVELGEHLISLFSGLTPKGGKETYVTDGVLFIRSQNVLVGQCDFSDAAYITHETHKSMGRSRVSKGDVFLNITGASIGRSAIMPQDCEANVNQHVAVLRTNENLDHLFLSTFLNADEGQKQIIAMQAGASREALNYSQIKQLRIPLPPLSTQQSIVAEIEAEQKLVDANRELVSRMEKKIQAALARVWGEDGGVAEGAA